VNISHGAAEAREEAESMSCVDRLINLIKAEGYF
jgi:hypothetical protein